MKTIYNEGRVVGLSNFELYVRQLLAEDPDAEVPSEREWLAATLANGASMLLKVPSGTPAGYSDFKLPNNSKLCAGNTLVATLFFGTADFKNNWATRITSYGDLIINTPSNHPVTPGQSADVPGDSTTDYTTAQKNLCKEYSKIMWGICFQPGTWTAYGQHNVGMELTPDFTKPAVVRIKFSQAITSDIYILIQGFTDHIVLEGTSSFESTMDTDVPQDGDFLGPESYPWANKIIFIEPSEILQFKEKYRLTHSITGNVDEEPIIDIDLASVSNYYTTNNFINSTKSDSVSDISASPNGVELLGIYPSSSGPRTAPALYSAQISSTGNKTLYPVDVVAPGTVKIFRNQQLALNYSVLLKNVFGMYLDSSNSLSMYDEEGNVVSLGSKLEVSTTKPYIAKVSTGSAFIKTISLTNAVSGSDLSLDGSAGVVNTAEITWAILLSCLADNKRITISHADHATSADYAANAGHAQTADTATNADHASSADSATNADHATNADTATNASHATSADSATNADHATTADKATCDASNNVITSTYGASLSIQGHSLSLYNKDGAVIDIEELPNDATTYDAGTGLKFDEDSDNTFVNTGVLQVTASSADAGNGTIEVTSNPNGVLQTVYVPVKGLDTAAYTPYTDYGTSLVINTPSGSDAHLVQLKNKYVPDLNVYGQFGLVCREFFNINGSFSISNQEYTDLRPYLVPGLFLDNPPSSNLGCDAWMVSYGRIRIISFRGFFDQEIPTSSGELMGGLVPVLDLTNAVDPITQTYLRVGCMGSDAPACYYYTNGTYATIPGMFVFVNPGTDLVTETKTYLGTNTVYLKNGPVAIPRASGSNYPFVHATVIFLAPESE